jgi:hypothetical protein
MWHGAVMNWTEKIVLSPNRDQSGVLYIAKNIIIQIAVVGPYIFLSLIVLY